MDLYELNERIWAGEKERQATGGAPAGTLSKIVCGRRFVCALVAVALPINQMLPAWQRELEPTEGFTVYCGGVVEAEEPPADPTALPLDKPIVGPMPDEYFLGFQAASISEHACGLDSRKRLRCFGNYPPIPANVIPRVIGMALGLHHTCIGYLDGKAFCFAGSQNEGPADSEWLTEIVGSATEFGFTGGGWPSIKSISIADSVACVLDADGQAYCGGERAQVELALIRPPVRLQPERTDLIERGVTFSALDEVGSLRL